MHKRNMMKQILLSILLPTFILGCMLCSKNSFSRAENTFSILPYYELMGLKWDLVELGSKPLAFTANPPYIRLEQANRMIGFTGCNRMMGSYESKDQGTLKFSYVATHMMACTDDQATRIEQQMLDALHETTMYQIDHPKGELLLLKNRQTGSHKELARFKAHLS